MDLNASRPIAELVEYAAQRGLIRPEERIWAINTVLEALGLEDYTEPEGKIQPGELAPLLDELTGVARATGALTADTGAAEERFRASLMGRLTPRPAQVIDTFWKAYARSPEAATDWYYRFSQDTDYIRRSRMPLDVRWTTETEYGTLDVTINLSKPEKDPRDIAAARLAPAAGWPACALCAENEGYPGRPGRAARQNHRIIPLRLGGEPWYLQYSPYVYYNEHCICLAAEHRPMRIDRACLARLLEFTGRFPHYFIGSNADLPVVGGSILSHDHFQGGRYEFAMARAAVERPFVFPGFADVEAGVVRWPMSVIRLTAADPERLIRLADRIVEAWRGYSDASVCLLAETDGTPHHTVTPIARRRGEKYELDLVLRSNLATREHPLGLYHPHAELHHIKKENIGLIEVMGLAVLPARLKGELTAVADALTSGGDLDADERTAAHADWARGLREKYVFTPDNAGEILRREVGLVFVRVLEQAGVFRRTEEGQAAFLRFLHTI